MKLYHNETYTLSVPTKICGESENVVGSVAGGSLLTSDICASTVTTRFLQKIFANIFISLKEILLWSRSSAYLKRLICIH